MLFKVSKIVIPFVWFGFVLSISFMEAPLKFTAPNVTLEIGLSIGRVIFQTLNKVEIAFALLLLFSVLINRPSGRLWRFFLAIPLVILLLETLWLLPMLDARAVQVVNGNAPPFSVTHIIYIVFDAVKLVSLFVIGVIFIRQNVPDDAKI